WLLAGPPWIEVHTRFELLRQPESASEVITARQAMIAHPRISALVEELAGWPGSILKSHKDAGHLLHKLTFAADLGLRRSDPGVDVVVDRILSHQSPDGPFQVLVNINPRYGGTGEDQWAWMLCDAPLILYALTKFGLADDDRIQAAGRYLANLIHKNGWPCVVSPVLGRFRGPGRKADPCPYANLVTLKALAQLPEWRESDVCRSGAEALLQLWQQRKERRPYLFAMGSGFTKLKAPLIWYDVLHVLDVLSRFPWLHGDPRFGEMIELVRSKADVMGRYTPESIWMAWKGWDFGQKREPSRWLTLITHRILNRLET
ncbi:MAG: hypothetical protein JSU61_02450, partial [Fidelibacterota bacterium]